MSFIQLLIAALALCAVSVTARNSAYEALTEGSEKFNANLFRIISSGNENKNLISSPQSAHVVLSMVSEGAKGVTRYQMRRALHLPVVRSFRHDGYRSLVDDFKSVKKVTLEIANKVYVSKGLKVNANYKLLVNDVFKAEADVLDTSDSAKAAKTVNDWADEKTHHKINQILDPSSIGADTRMILLNAIYFKGKWAHQFQANATTDAPFSITKDQKINVPTMYVSGKFRYGVSDDLKAQVIELPYQDEDVTMMIVIPNEIDGLKELEKNIGSYSYENITYNSDNAKVNLWMPKFKIESDIPLNEPLKKLRMESAFSDKANFSGISSEKLKIDQVKQKAFIEVNEEGSEAAAVTVAVIALRASSDHPVDLHVDRPFYFAIRKGHTTLFQGHVYDPTK